MDHRWTRRGHPGTPAPKAKETATAHPGRRANASPERRFCTMCPSVACLPPQGHRSSGRVPRRLKQAGRARLQNQNLSKTLRRGILWPRRSKRIGTASRTAGARRRKRRKQSTRKCLKGCHTVRQPLFTRAKTCPCEPMPTCGQSCIQKGVKPHPHLAARSMRSSCFKCLPSACHTAHASRGQGHPNIADAS